MIAGALQAIAAGRILLGIDTLRRGDLPGRSAELLTALTGAYAAIGAARLAADVAGGRN